MRRVAVASLLSAAVVRAEGSQPQDACGDEQEGSSLLQAASRASLKREVCPPPGFDSVENFSVSDYISAPWYIQMQAENSYQPKENFFCVRANYTETTPGIFSLGQAELELIVDNYARQGSTSGPDSPDFPLRASIVDLTQPSKLIVGPAFLPLALRGPYWVVAASEQPYEWAIVSGGPPTGQGADGCVSAKGAPGLDLNPNGNDEGFWLLTREPVAPNGTVDMMLEKAKSLGFDTGVLLPVQQEGCCGEKYGTPC